LLIGWGLTASIFGLDQHGLDLLFRAKIRLNIDIYISSMAEQSKLPQRHPQEKIDRALVDLLLESDPQESMALAELARLRIRYNGFPGATDIQANLDRLLIEWHLTEEQLFAKTRELHNGEQIYQVKAKKYQEQEDWN
jgi:Protein of unknown function (DUF3288)